MATKEIRITIEIKDSQGEWFKVFNYPAEGTLTLDANAPSRLAEVIQAEVEKLQPEG